MRFKKATKKKEKSKVTLTENEIIEACCEFIKNKGHKPASICWLKLPKIREKVDKLGRKRECRIEFQMELEE